MFRNIPVAILDQMHALEDADARDRLDGTPRPLRLRQIPPESGRFLAFLLALAPDGQVLEIGTSAGYSSLWLSLACNLRSCHLITFEKLPEKIERARRTFQSAGVFEIIKLVEGDARLFLSEYQDIAFCFLDAEKEVYADCYQLVLPNLVQGGILAIDNATSHPEIEPFIQSVLADQRVDALVVPIGKGVLVCRKS